ncbi:hypothetical protein HOLleu_06439 [Holothuria leucospilota]|uniref:Uncharacterized protein n=1 Tax=Holothuria leucospilota TaxID=206669 RepID=A0A9Q1HJM7_HOLLE|nr:hypothetical protein HOLleu_06439 [Holothuria leucospilota]
MLTGDCILQRLHTRTQPTLAEVQLDLHTYGCSDENLKNVLTLFEALCFVVGGFYLDDIGSTSDTPGKFLCKKCANGTYVTKKGGGSRKDCVDCPDGTNKSIHAGFRACFCKNDFARTKRFEKCSRCVQPGLKCTGQDFQSLEPGYFWDWSFPDASIDEYNAFVENLLNETRFYDNNTHYSKEIPRVHKCPLPASCISNFNEDRSVEGTCAVGYEGWVCSKCVPGYYLVYSSCLRCPDVKVLFLELGLLICVGTVVVYAIWRDSFHEKNVSSERKTADIIVSRVKIALGFYQVIGKYLSSLNYIKFEGAMQFTFEIISSVEMNVLKFFIRPQCFSKKLVINPKVEFIIAMTAFFTFTTLPFLLYKISKVYFSIRYQGVNFNNRLTNLKAKTLLFVVGMIFITYPPICFSVFQLFPGAFKSFCLDLENKHCFTALRSDYDLRCDKQLIVYQVLAVMATVGYVVAFPLVLLYMLRKYCSAQFSQENKGRKNSTTKHEITPFLTKDKRGRHLPPCLNFLCENYRSDYWYWEIVELARKVTQTVLIIIFGWGNKITVLLTIGMSVVFLLLHARYRPMKSGREQRLQVFCWTVFKVEFPCLRAECFLYKFIKSLASLKWKTYKDP